MTSRDARRPALTRDLLNPTRFFTRFESNFSGYVFTISTIADFDDAARREATANASQTRATRENTVIHNICAFASSSERPPPRAATSKFH